MPDAEKPVTSLATGTPAGVGAPQGIFLRAGDTKNALSALEVQVHENTDGALYGMVGAIYNAQPPA